MIRWAACGLVSKATDLLILTMVWEYLLSRTRDTATPAVATVLIRTNYDKL
jgi:hypothetical protein